MDNKSLLEFNKVLYKTGQQSKQTAENISKSYNELKGDIATVMKSMSSTVKKHFGEAEATASKFMKTNNKLAKDLEKDHRRMAAAQKMLNTALKDYRE